MGDIILIRGLGLLKHKFIVWSEWGDQRPKKWDDHHLSFYDIFCVGLVLTPIIIVIGIVSWILVRGFS